MGGHAVGGRGVVASCVRGARGLRCVSADTTPRRRRRAMRACRRRRRRRPAADADADAGSADSDAAAARRTRGVLRGTYTRLNGRRDDLARYRGDVVLVVNTATECGYTPQFEGLEALYRERRADGLVVLGFPANDFAGQEPRSNDEIAEFCKANYGVTFPMFAKTRRDGRGREPAVPAARRRGRGAGVELQQVPRRPAREGRRAVRRGDRAGRSGARGAARSAAVIPSGPERMFWSWKDEYSPRDAGRYRGAVRVGWLIDQGRQVFLPFGHSPDVDLVADLRRPARARAGQDLDRRISNGRYQVIARHARRQSELERARQALQLRPLRLPVRPRRRWAALVHPLRSRRRRHGDPRSAVRSTPPTRSSADRPLTVWRTA